MAGAAETITRNPHYGTELSVGVIDEIIDHQKGHISCRPRLLSVSPSIAKNIEQHDKGYWNVDVRARFFRFLMMTATPLVMLISIQRFTNKNAGDGTHYLSIAVGICIATMFTFYFLNLFIQLYPGCGDSDEDAYLFRIQTRLSRVDKWATMRIANTQVLYRLQPIQSISEFSAISGGQANQMIANLGPFAMVGVVMVFAARMQCLQCPSYSQYTFDWDVAEILVLIGVTGITMIGLFELNAFDPGMKLGHYVGVTMTICILFASLIQGGSISTKQDDWTHMIVPILLNLIAWPCFIGWFFFLSNENRAKEFEKRYEAFVDGKDQDFTETKEYSDFERGLEKEVHKLSVSCLVCEGTVIYCVSWALAWFLVQWGSTCEYGCIRPF